MNLNSITTKCYIIIYLFIYLCLISWICPESPWFAACFWPILEMQIVNMKVCGNRLRCFEQVNNATARVMTNKKVANPYTNGKCESQKEHLHFVLIASWALLLFFAHQAGSWIQWWELSTVLNCMLVRETPRFCSQNYFPSPASPPHVPRRT